MFVPAWVFIAVGAAIIFYCVGYWVCLSHNEWKDV